MRIRAMLLRTVALVAAALAALAQQTVAGEKPAPASPKIYSSPQAVFEAYRQALDKQDWRTVFSCGTPEAQDEKVFEAYFGLHLRPSNPKVLAVEEKYGVQTSAVDTEYYERYREKHGIDMAKIMADRQKAVEKTRPNRAQQKAKLVPVDPDEAIPGSPQKRAPPDPPFDEDLFRKVLLTRVTDKAGFFEAVNQILANRDYPPPGKLESVTIQGDKATGRASRIIYHISSESGKPDRKIGETFPETFHFRKSKAGWLIESDQ